MAHIEDRWKRPGNRDRLRYRARYIAPDGRERSKSFAKKADAKNWLDAQEASKVTQTWTDPALGRTLLRDWFDEWWATTTNLRASTAARDETYIRGYVLPSLGDAQLAALSQREVRGWVAELAARGLAPATVQKAYQLLGKLMAAAVDANMIAASPCRRVPLPRIEREEMRFLTPAEINRLADAIGVRYRALVLLGAYGGLRIGEMAGLRRGRVDLKRGMVEVVEIAVEVRGKLHTGPPKTRAGRRWIALPRIVVEALERHVPEGADPQGWVFGSSQGAPLRVMNFRHWIWLPATKAAGLTGLRIHDLRHTAVALWIAAGANPKAVSARAGHASVSFTLDRYGHLYPEADVQLRDHLDALIEDATAPRRPQADSEGIGEAGTNPEDGV
jgi:integrase